MMLDPATDRARGYMLLGIFYMHALISYASVRSPDAIMLSFVQIKLLSPHVSVFFLLSGMGSRQLARRSFPMVVRQGAALVLLAILSHLSGIVLNALMYAAVTGPAVSLEMLVRPIVIGTEYSTFVAWFFLSLAMARVLAWLFYRNLALFAAVALGLAALALGSLRLGLPDNIYEWRTWPAAVVFFLIGSRLPPILRVPLPLGLAAGAGSAVLTWFNRPGVVWDGPCLSCNVTFVSQPVVGEFGSIPVFLAQELAFLIFLLAVSRMVRPQWLTRAALHVGRNSTQFLLLNGWVILAINPLVLPLLPPGDRLWVFALLLVGGALVHLALYRLLHKPLDLLIFASFKVVNRVAALVHVLRRLRWSRRQSLE